MVTNLACLLGAYLLGAVPFGYLGVRIVKGIDIRELGSGNIGTTNVKRVAGWGLAIPILILDVSKGLVPVVAVSYLAGVGVLAPGLSTSLTQVGCAFLAIVGHMASVFLRGQGGKGVATGLGGILALVWQSALLGLATWLLLVLVVRYVSVASCVAALAVAGSAWIFVPDPLRTGLPLSSFVTVIAILVVWKHRANFGRLARGEEPRVLVRSDPPE